MTMSGRSILLCTCLLTSIPLRASPFSDQEAGPGQPASWTLYVENDSFLKTDRYYTNGIRLTKSFGKDGLPRWAHRTRWIQPVLDQVHLCRQDESNRSCFNYETAWTFGQNIYTPNDLLTSRLLRSQRPYGAWLYYGNVLTLSNPDQQHSLEIDAGDVGGSLALGQPVQSRWHALLRSIKNSDTPPDPKGWGHQINNQPGLQVLYQRRQRWLDRQTPCGLRADLVPQLNAAFGTVNVQASVGATVRFGYNVPNDFPDDLTIPSPPPPPEPEGPPGVALASYHQTPPFEAWAPSHKERRWEAYLFARADRRYVAYNAFLDGNINVFGRSQSVTKDPLVTDLQVGAVLGRRHWRCSLTVVDRSPEFKAQRDHQRFVSITVLRRR